MYAFSSTEFDNFGNDKYISCVEKIDHFMVRPKKSPPLGTPHNPGCAQWVSTSPSPFPKAILLKLPPNVAIHHFNFLLNKSH